MYSSIVRRWFYAITSFVGLVLFAGELCTFFYFLGLLPFNDFILMCLNSSLSQTLYTPSIVGGYLTFGLMTLLIGTFGSYFTLSYLGLYGNVVLGIMTLVITTGSFLLAYPCVILKGQVINVTLFK